ncbi:MAG: undecaprenyl-diphosphate phosphatase [Saprospiraceae bacterium]
MSEYLITLILGIVQGITEFLPISSDGHLEIAKYFLGDKSSGFDSLQLTVMLHIATTLSICVVFRKKILELINGFFKWDPKTIKLIGLILISMIPAAIVGLFFEDYVSSFFDGNISFVALMLIINGFILWLGNRAIVSNTEITKGKSFLIGIAQMFAILPGISRSGSTISLAALLNINRSEAAEFSFIILLPLIFGKIAKDIFSGSFNTIPYSFGAMAVGFLAAFIVGIFAFQLLLKLVANIKLHYFAYYCMLVGTLLYIYVKFLMV